MICRFIRLACCQKTVKRCLESWMAVFNLFIFILTADVLQRPTRQGKTVDADIESELLETRGTRKRATKLREKELSGRLGDDSDRYSNDLDDE